MLHQWYLFVILFCLYAFSKLTNQSYQVHIAGEAETRYRWFPALVMIAVLTYVAAVRGYVADTSAYINFFYATPDSLLYLPTVLTGDVRDKGFTVFNIIVKSLIGNQIEVYLGIIAFFCIICVVSVYKKYSCNFFITMFLYLASADYYQWTHNGMRQFIAVAMIFAATDLLLQKKYIRYIAVILLASTFHASALIMIPMCFVVQGSPWNSKTVLFILAVLIAVSFADTLTGTITSLMENTQYAGEVALFLASDGTNILRVLVYAIPPILALLFRRRLAYADVPIVNLSVNMSIASLGAYLVSMVTSGVLIGRMGIYFSLYNYMLLPWIIQRTFEKRSANLIHLMLMGCYMIYYYYQMHIAWGL